MTARASVLLFCSPIALQADPGAVYTLAPATVDGGGTRGSSASYTADFSFAPGGAGASAAYTSRTGYAGQLEEAASLEIRIQPSTLAENGSGQLRARLLNADGVSTDVAPGQIVWSVPSGPLGAVSSEGVVTAQSVYQSTVATVQGIHSGVAGRLTFPVLETLPDNFGLYAGDGLPDWWQVLHFGLSEPAGGQSGDPDHDGVSNLLEYAFGMRPSRSDADPVSYTGDSQVSPGVPATWVGPSPFGVDFRAIFSRRKPDGGPALFYTVQFSANLVIWQNSAAVPDIRATGGEAEAVSVRYPLFLDNGQKAKFFRVKVETAPASP